MQRSDPIEKLKRRSLPDGGFCEKPGGEYRPEATAWAVIALRASGKGDELIAASAMARLAKSQTSDGRIAVDPGYPEGFWPTPLSILAWHGAPEYEAHGRRAIEFLIETSGSHRPRDPGHTGHDTAIEGWPWIGETHSWVEPTAMALMALRVENRETTDRAQTAVELLMNRQLVSGGWNYGNTIVFDQELNPMPDMTGMALQALSGIVHPSAVADSLDYLDRILPGLMTPLSLGWAILGLSAWQRRPEETASQIQICLDRQDRYGHYSTTLLSLLLIADCSEHGLFGMF